MARGAGVFSYPAFVRLWISDTVKWFGVFTSGLALQLLLIETLGANQVELGLVRSAQWLPMLLFGLVAGVLIDRVRRQPVLVAGDAVCALAFGAIGVLGLLGQLTVPLVAALVFVAGTASLSATAAHQSFLPRLVPTSQLSRANARIEQSMTAAEAVGPLLAGVLVRVASAPVAILVNAATYAASALTLATIRVEEPTPSPDTERHLWRELREGAAFVYRHRTLAPYALGLHTWFFFNSAVLTILVFFATQELGLGPVAIGLVLASAGITGVFAAGLTPRIADRFGAGPVMVSASWLAPVAFLIAALAPTGTRGLLALIGGQLLYGISNGLRGPLEMSYRNAVTPDRLRARMNSTIRSLNWGTITVSAPLAGWLAVTVGNRTTILVCVVGLVVAAAIPTFSPFRSAQMPADGHEPD